MFDSGSCSSVLCLFLVFLFLDCYVRQTKLASSVDNVWAHYKIVIDWLIDQFLKVFFVIIASSCTVYVFYGSMSARTSAKPPRGASMHTSQQSSEVVAAAAVADSDAPEVGAACTASAMPVLVFVLAAVAVTSVVDPRL